MNALKIAGLVTTMVVAVSALVAADAPAEAGASRQIQSTDIQSKAIEIVGTLGKPLGTYSTIQGTLEARTKEGFSLVVDVLDDKKLAKTVRVQLKGVKEETGARYVLRGFETMSAYGTPHDPRLPEDMVTAFRGDTIGMFSYDVWFQVTSLQKSTLPTEGR